MRISDNTKFANFVPAFNDLVYKQYQVQQQIASGIRIQKLSDDASAAVQSQAHTQHIAGLDQSNINIGEATDWSMTTEGVLNRAMDMLQRVRELTVQAGDGTMGNLQRQQLVPEIDDLLKGMVELGTQTHLGNRVFSGARTNLDAFTATTNALGQVTAVTYNGDGGDRSIEVTPGHVAEYNLLGSNENGGIYGAFRDTTAGVDVFQALIDLRTNLQANNVTAISNVSLADIDKSMAHLEQGRSFAGALQNRLSSAESLNVNTIDLETKSRAKLEETDLASAAVQMAQLQTQYQAALKTGANLMQTSLLDYLR